MRRCAPWRRDLDRLLQVDRDAEVRRQEVGRAGRQDGHRRVAAGEHVDAALARAVAAPDQEVVGAGRERLAHGLGRLAALVDLAATADRRRRSGASTARSSASPPPSVLPVCATTAIRLIAALRLAAALPSRGLAPHGLAVRPRREQGDQDRADAHAGARELVQRVVHAAVQPRHGHDQRQRDRERPAHGLHPARSATASSAGARGRRRPRSRRRRGPTGSSGSAAGRRGGGTSGRSRWTSRLAAR